MRALLPILIAALIAVPASAGGRRRTAAVSATREEVTIAFVGVTSGSGPDAMIDAGTMSHIRSHHRLRTMTTKTFGIQLSGPGKTATLRASLESFDGRCTVRIDGIELGTAAKVITARAPLGAVTTHTLQIEVPDSAPEGAFAMSVRWEAITD
jgi:hypothetical protein